jgi:DNA processing protein
MISFAQLTLLHLNLIEGVGAATIAQIIARKPNDVRWQDFYTLSLSDVQKYFGLNPMQAQRITVGLADSSILEQELTLLARHNIAWCTVLDEHYPAFLKEIYAPPAVLYYRGSQAALHKQALAMVGSRKVNEYGIQVIKQLVPDLVAADYALVSGGAVGADSCVHEQTLASNGITIAVLGSGLLKPYPKENKRLFDAIIAQGGALVSSFALNASALPGNFPARNRIIAGLSKGCIVIQAAEQSGALITAQYALEHGRDVFAVPGLITDHLSAGCHALLQQGALLVQSSDDILREYGASLKSKKQQVCSDVKVTSEECSAGEQLERTWDKELVMLCKTPKSLDDLIAITHRDYAQLTTQLFELQIAGVVSQNFMGMWEAKNT